MFEPGEIFLFVPVGADTLINDTGAVLLYGELWESFGDHFGDACALVLAEEFIAELDDVVAECVLDDLVDAEGDFVDELLLGL